MFLTLLTLTLGCFPGEWEDAKVPSANGRFTLEVTRTSLALREKGALRWQHDGPPGRSSYRVADSGAWVAELPYSECVDCAQVVLYGADGKTVAQVKLLPLLSEEEQQFLERSDCGVQWWAKATAAGDTLVVEVLQSGGALRFGDPGPTVRFTVDARTGNVTRGPAVPRPGIAELLADYGRAADAQSRQRLFDALVRKAALTSSRGNRPLAEFLRARAQSSDDVRMREAATQALGQVGSEADLKAMAGRPRGDDVDLATLAALEARDAAGAQQFALQALRDKRAPELLRQRAVGLLVRDGTAACWEAAALGLADPSEKVRDDTVYRLAGLPRSQRAWDLLLAAAPGSVRARTGILQQYLDFPDDPAWRTQLNAAVVAGKLDPWGGALVVAAAMAEVRKDAATARALYERGVAVLDRERPKTSFWVDAQPWCEAKLRLAQLAADRNEADEALRLARQVAASGYGVSVSAPAPMRIAGGTPGASSAQTVAQALIATKGAPLPPPFQPPDVGQQIRMLEELNKAMRARAASPDGRGGPVSPPKPE